MTHLKKIALGILCAYSCIFFSSAAAPLTVKPTDNKIEIIELEALGEDEDDISPAEQFYIDSLSLYNNPAAELYSFSWTSERLNPYRIKIDSMPDSVHIDCRDFVYPLSSNRITSNFGMRRYRYHYGIDLGVTIGDTIRASFGGKIRIINYEAKGYGHYIVIRHDNGLETIYAHLSGVLVTINQQVKAGDPIGLAGNTGHSTGPHLHYEIRFLGNAFNPTKLIDFTKKELYTKEYCIVKKDTYSHKKELNSIAQARYHKVRSGNTLSSISRRYGVSVKQLCKLNKIRPTTKLRVGQKIRYK